MMLRNILLASALVAASTVAAQAAEPDSCKKVRFSDVGWTDIQATTGLTVTLLKGLGYDPTVEPLSVEVTFQSMKNKDIDVFLGNWMPSMTSQIEPYTKEGTIETLKTPNLEGAGYGMVVPDYVAAAGVKDLKDLSAHKADFDGKIYGIEPGNDGNKIVQGFIDDKKNGLDGWELVESSEQGMLTQAEKLMKDKKWVVFLGWTPHPVMGTMKITYLSGVEDAGFGPATVFTNTRPGYSAECPNVGKLLSNLKFDLAMEGSMMDDILSKGKDGETAGTDWLKANPQAIDTYLAGVTTVDGKDGAAAVKSSLGL